MPNESIQAVDVRVTGEVQGVSFRAYCVREARRIGVAGWVRNEPDGSVSVHAEGAPAYVDQLVRWCHDGSPSAQVVNVETSPAQPQGYAEFEQR